ncbi:MAG: hypothetical protein U1F65_02415 [Verrucomicrobiota bacterium]
MVTDLKNAKCAGGIVRSGLWPGLTLLPLFNPFFTQGSFHVEVHDGRLYGVLTDILNHGSKVMLLRLAWRWSSRRAVWIYRLAR